MRIIGGTHKGRIIATPRDLPVRPTTDFAKEALFNILQNRFELNGLKVLDLFSGTGHIAIEFASRGAAEVSSVDKHPRCVAFQHKTLRQLNLQVQVIRADVFEFLKQSKGPYDLIFADPPYDLDTIPEIHRLVFEAALLKPGGWLVIEHGQGTKLSELAHHVQERRYGGVFFSIFEAV